MIEPVLLMGIPVDFILFGLTLLGVALFHHHTLPIALTGLAAITAYKLAFTGFKFGAGLAGLGLHLQHEWVILSNLFLLLMGFALLSRETLLLVNNVLLVVAAGGLRRIGEAPVQALLRA